MFALALVGCANLELAEQLSEIGTASEPVSLACNSVTRAWLWDASACGGSKGYRNNGNTSYASSVSKVTCDANCSSMIKARYDAWMTSRYTDLGTSHGRIKWEVGQDQITVSEGMGYGITGTALFDDPVKLERLTRFYLYDGANSFQDEDGLMHWKIRCPDSNVANCRTDGTGAAGDADDDAVYGWMLACKKCSVGAWTNCPTFTVKSVGGAGGAGKSYCGLVDVYEDRMRRSYIDHSGSDNDASGNSNGGLTSAHPSYILMAGDEWRMPQEFPHGIGNISYFDPAVFRGLGNKVSAQSTFWRNVIDRQTAFLHIMQEGDGKAGTSGWVSGISAYDAADHVSGSCSNLPLNWHNYSGACQRVSWHGDQSCDYYWDAPRTLFRLARDYAWNNQSGLQSLVPLKRIARFMAGLPKGTSAYTHYPWGNMRLNGTLTGDISSYHKAHALTALWAGHNLLGESGCRQSATCGLSSTTNNWCTASAVNELYGYVRDDTEVDYFKTFWRVMSLALVTGNMPNPFTTATQTFACVKDGVKNGAETDVDCGGPCQDCGYAKLCMSGTDCNTGVCSSGRCAANCSNKKKDGNETGVDCGGACGACNSCSDGARNGYESDTDCGGGLCSDCSLGRNCRTSGDCQSGVCANGQCVAAASCSDKIRNQGESGIDCGGPCAMACPNSGGGAATPDGNATPLPGVVATNDTGKANTLSAYCYKIRNSIQGWVVNEAQSRSATVKRKSASGTWTTLATVSSSTIGSDGSYQPSLSPNYCPGADGYLYICLGAAESASARVWASVTAWGPAQGTCN
jgi:hypothetical protein